MGWGWSPCASARRSSEARSNSCGPSRDRARWSACAFRWRPRRRRMSDRTITVLLADDHSLVRRGFRRMLEDDDAIAVVGEAANGDEAIAMAGQVHPAVVVME